MNVHNQKPLEPFKVSQRFFSSKNDSNQTFKIRKFLKLANRTERRRIEKFKIKKQQQTTTNLNGSLISAKRVTSSVLLNNTV